MASYVVSPAPAPHDDDPAPHDDDPTLDLMAMLHHVRDSRPTLAVNPEDLERVTTATRERLFSVQPFNVQASPYVDPGQMLLMMPLASFRLVTEPGPYQQGGSIELD